MALCITVEVLPAGGAPPEQLGVITINNTREQHPHGPTDLFKYEVLCEPGDADERRKTRARYVGHVWHARSHGWWQLVGQAFALAERDRR